MRRLLSTTGFVLCLTLTLSAAVTDTFNRADGAVGANWTAAQSTALISGNTCVASAGSTVTHLYWNAVSFNNNQSSSVVIVTGPSLYGGVSVRMTGTGATTSGYYVNYGYGIGIILRRYDNGVDTNLANDGGAYTPAGGDTFTLAVTGTTLTVSVNGASVLSATDATYASGSPGLFFYESGGPVAFDSWTATGEVGGATRAVIMGGGVF